ncbi:nuclear transport factor 2 family protein [Paracoccus sp. YIM 132242]|uniref:Nuclear transport factor 2 family protein n=1 Tax=Paracoccus lichenicola TaxID=2665644 RepID=A0A6L6HSL1_9RHOB|nr:nuclear transport factor 2 family protein [Paracoccus lichenicola]MTE00288.1 nuclear transport factor 2 family protein [Paracoccus lichenicola]
MDTTVQVLLDKQAIQEVLYRYCRGVDRCDADIVRSAYHPDSTDDHGYWKGNGHDFARFVTARLLAANSQTTHSVTNTLIEVSGDHAWSEAYVMVTLVRRSDDPVVVDVMGARYLDRHERRAGEWRIAHRLVVLDWTRVETWVPRQAPIALDDFALGQRREADPLYAWIRAHGHVVDQQP